MGLAIEFLQPTDGNGIMKNYAYMVIVALASFVQPSTSYADAAAPLPAPGILGLVIVSILAAVAIARERK